MTTTLNIADILRNGQDSTERHGYVEIEAVDGGGHIVKVRGSGKTEDDEVFMISVAGLGINMPKDTDAEVHLLAGGDDSSLKFAIVAIPHDKEHKYKPGQNGLQKFDDPSRRLQWGNNLFHITDKGIALGPNGEIELRDGKIYLRAEVIASEDIKTMKNLHAKMSVRTPTFGAPVVPDVPGFTPD